MTVMRLLLILVLCILVRSDIPPNTTSNFTDISTTKPTNETADPTILCRSQCLRFNSNSNIFNNNQTQMLLNFTKMLYAANTHFEVIDSLKYYSNPFILKFIQNAKGLQLLEEYRDRLNAKFGADTVKEFVQNRYSDCACVECSNDIVSYTESVGISDDLLDLEEIADTLDEQVYKPLILLPTTKFPRFQIPSRRLLQTRFPNPEYWEECIDRSEGRVMQMSCYDDCLQEDYNNFFPPGYDPFHPSLNYILPSGGHPSQMDDGFIDERMEGLPHFILNKKKFRKLVLDSHANCNQGVFVDTCK